MKSFILIFLVNASIHLIKAFNLEDHTTNTSITEGGSVIFTCKSNANFGTCTFEHNDEKCEFEYTEEFIGGDIKAIIKKTNCEASWKDRMTFIGDLNTICKIRLEKVDKEMDEGQWSCELKVVMYSGNKSQIGFRICFSGSGRVQGSTFWGCPPRVFSGF